MREWPTWGVCPLVNVRELCEMWVCACTYLLCVCACVFEFEHAIGFLLQVYDHIYSNDLRASGLRVLFELIREHALAHRVFAAVPIQQKFIQNWYNIDIKLIQIWYKIDIKLIQNWYKIDTNFSINHNWKFTPARSHSHALSKVTWRRWYYDNSHSLANYSCMRWKYIQLKESSHLNLYYTLPHTPFSECNSRIFSMRYYVLIKLLLQLLQQPARVDLCMYKWEKVLEIKIIRNISRIIIINY